MRQTPTPKPSALARRLSGRGDQCNNSENGCLISSSQQQIYARIGAIPWISKKHHHHQQQNAHPDLYHQSSNENTKTWHTNAGNKGQPNLSSFACPSRQVMDQPMYQQSNQIFYHPSSRSEPGTVTNL